MPGLHDLTGGPRKRRKRVGRGPGSGHGKTSTRGHKGQKARSGGGKGPGFEGGQMPLQRRLPMRGFNNKRFARELAIVNVRDLNRFEDGAEVTPEALLKMRILRALKDGVKVLGEGDLERRLTVSAHAFSQEAARKIREAGGQVVSLVAAAETEAAG